MPTLSTDQQDRLWDHFQNRDADSFSGSEPRLRYLAGLIPSGGCVLNVGVGSGLFERYALQRRLDVYALDPSEKSIQSLREQYGLEEKAQVGYGQKMPFADDSFETVVVSEVLEHLPNPVLDQTLKEIQRVLRNNGRVLGTVPAREDLQSQVVLCPHCGKLFHRWGHEQSFTTARIRELLGRYFIVNRAFEKRFVHWPQLNWRGKLVASAQLLLGPLTSAGKNIVFAASKLPAEIVVQGRMGVTVAPASQVAPRGESRDAGSS